jgi:succinate dehydrogenase / fumarate reductase flavoprotein subunit/fumarate reductase (CoM/CoB) subunit A
MPAAAHAPLGAPAPRRDLNPAAEIAELQAVMHRHVGPLRTRSGLEEALAHVGGLGAACTELPAPQAGLDPEWIDWHDLANMRLVAECVIRGALAREESRGAHQRADFPAANDEWRRHLRLRLAPEGLRLDR